MLDIFGKSITAKNIVFFVTVVLFIVFLSKIKDVAILFFASFVIACSLNPLVDKLSKKMSRGMASALVLGGGLFIISMFFVPLFVMGGHQVKSFLQLLPAHYADVKTYIFSLPYIHKPDFSSMSYSDFVSPATGITSNLVDKSIILSKGLASALIYFLAACLIIYYFMADKATVEKTYLSLFPKNIQPKAENILESISNKVGGYVIAQIATMASVGIIVSLGLMILGVDYAILLGLISALFDLVPVVGPTVALVVILLAVYKLGVLKIVLVAFVFLFAQWAENNLVRPYIFSKFMDLHPLIIYFFLLITARYLGIVGVIFAPAIAATVCVLFEELYIKNINKL